MTPMRWIPQLESVSLNSNTKQATRSVLLEVSENCPDPTILSLSEDMSYILFKNDEKGVAMYVYGNGTLECSRLIKRRHNLKDGFPAELHEVLKEVHL